MWLQKNRDIQQRQITHGQCILTFQTATNVTSQFVAIQMLDNFVVEINLHEQRAEEEAEKATKIM